MNPNCFREMSCQEIYNLLNTADHARLALCCNNQPYVIPVNFSWECVNGRLHISFSLCNNGEALRTLRNNGRAALEFEVERDDCIYSVVARGVVSSSDGNVAGTTTCSSCPFFEDDGTVAGTSTGCSCSRCRRRRRRCRCGSVAGTSTGCGCGCNGCVGGTSSGCDCDCGCNGCVGGTSTGCGCGCDCNGCVGGTSTGCGCGCGCGNVAGTSTGCGCGCGCGNVAGTSTGCGCGCGCGNVAGTSTGCVTVTLRINSITGRAFPFTDGTVAGTSTCGCGC